MANETAFQVKDGKALYILREIDSDTATGYGCAGSTHMLIGAHGHMIGTVTPVTGKLVKVPGWPTRKGMLAVFTPWGSPSTGEAFKGYIGESVG